MAPLMLTGFVSKVGFMNKTATVTIVRHVFHPLTRKRLMSRKKFLVHDEENVLRLEDEVRVKQCRKLSARKYFTLDRVLRSPQALLEQARALRAMGTKVKEGTGEAVTMGLNTQEPTVSADMMARVNTS